MIVLPLVGLLVAGLLTVLGFLMISMAGGTDLSEATMPFAKIAVGACALFIPIGIILLVLGGTAVKPDGGEDVEPDDQPE